jgi:hypothetical protein
LEINFRRWISGASRSGLIGATLSAQTRTVHDLAQRLLFSGFEPHDKIDRRRVPVEVVTVH